jgi:hypothetical protein
LESWLGIVDSDVTTTQNESSKETAQGPSPNISATGSTEVGLDRIRTLLLDLANRNKLLNFIETL